MYKFDNHNVSTFQIGNNIRIFKFSKKEDGGPTNIQPALETDFPKVSSLIPNTAVSVCLRTANTIGCI